MRSMLCLGVALWAPVSALHAQALQNGDSMDRNRPVLAADKMRRSLEVELPNQEHNAIRTSWPAIGCWFWTAEEFQPEFSPAECRGSQRQRAYVSI